MPPMTIGANDMDLRRRVATELANAEASLNAVHERVLAMLVNAPVETEALQKCTPLATNVSLELTSCESPSTKYDGQAQTKKASVVRILDKGPPYEQADGWVRSDHEEQLAPPSQSIAAAQNELDPWIPGCLPVVPQPQGTAPEMPAISPDPSEHEQDDETEVSEEAVPVFQVAHMWVDRRKTKVVLQHSQTRVTIRWKLDEAAVDEDGPKVAAIELVEKGFCKQALIHPHHYMRVSWDVSSLFLVCVDLVLLPLQTFDLGENAVVTALAWLTRFFWSVDLVLSFFTGQVQRDGSVELRLRIIARRYLATWFGIDFFIVSIDWIEFFWKSGVSDNAGYARVTKITRIFRLVRLLRVVKMQSIFKLIIERSNSEILIILADLGFILFIMLAFAHLIACLWFGVGKLFGNCESWPKHYEIEGTSLAIRYFAALHWSITQFSGGMDEFKPQCITERIFAINVFLLAFILACLFVSSITSSMTKLNILSSTESQKMSMLRRYMLQNKIPRQLALRVQRSAEQTMLEQQRYMPEEHVVALRMVSQPLRIEVHFAMYSELLKCHSFFNRYVSECPHVMRQLCHSSMYMMHGTAGDILFTPGERPEHPKMYIFCSGSLRYVAISGNQHNVVSGVCCSEANLWTNWAHRGQLTATSDVRIACIDAARFQNITGTFDHPELFDPCWYAEKFVVNLNTIAKGDGELTDLVDPLDIDEVLAERPWWHVKSHDRSSSEPRFSGGPSLSRSLSEKSPASQRSSPRHTRASNSSITSKVSAVSFCEDADSPFSDYGAKRGSSTDTSVLANSW